MNERTQYYHRRAIYTSGGLHLFIIFALCFSFNIKPASDSSLPSTSLVAPIQAISVNQDKVQQEIAKIKQEQEVKNQTEINHQKELKRLEAQAVQQRIQEQKQLTQLKTEATQLQEQKKQIETDAVKRLTEIKQQQTLAQTQLENLKKQQQTMAAKPKPPVPTHTPTPTANPAANQQPQQETAEQKIAENLLQQQIAEEQQHLASINQQMLQSEIEKYKALILNAIGRQWIMPPNVDKSLSAQFQINLDPTGKVLAVQLLQSSGDPILDNSVQLAIQKASPLPMPTSPDLLSNFKELHLTVRPQGLMGETIS